MKDFLIVLKFLIKQNFSIKPLFHKIKTDKKYRNMFIFVSIVLLLTLSSYAVFIGLFVELFKTFQGLYLQSLYIVMAIIMSVFLIFFFGMFQIMSNFYFSDDVKILTPMPIKTSHVMISKFIIIYLWEIIINLFSVFPLFIIYGVFEFTTVYHWFTMSLAFLLLPIVPLVVVGILTILLMSTTNLFKNRDMLRLIGYLLFLGLILGFQFYFSKTMLTLPEDIEGQKAFLENLVGNNSYFLEKFSEYYPITYLFNDALTGTLFEAVLGVIGLGLIGGIAISLFTWVLERVFLKSYLLEQNNNQGKRKRKIKNIKGHGNVSKSISKIDFITLLKVPMYLLNTLSIVILIPVIFLIYAVLMPLLIEDQDLQKMVMLYQDNRAVFWLACSVFLGAFSALTPIASTTFSREGKTNWIMRTLPISAKDHTLGRFYTPFFTHVTFVLIMMGIIVTMLISLGIYDVSDFIYIIISIVLSSMSSIWIILLGIYIDLKRPMLKWENPQQPVKQNLNVIISLGIGIIYITAMVFLYRLLNQYLLSTLLFVIFFIFIALLAYIIYKILIAHFEENLMTME